MKSKAAEYGEIVYRPVDRRENYVKRCVAIAGDRFEIRNNQLIVNGKAQDKFAGVQYNYFVQTDGTILSPETFDKLHISKDDIAEYSTQQGASDVINFLGLNPALPVYHFPLSQESYNAIQQVPGVKKVVIEPAVFAGEVFPLGGGKKWDRDNYGPVWVPKRGARLALNHYNLPIYERIIRVYEHNKLEV